MQIGYMSAMTPDRLAYGIAPFIACLRAHSIDPNPMLVSAHIPLYAATEPAFTFSIDQEMAFLRQGVEALRKATTKPASLALAEHCHIRHCSVLGLAVQSAPTPIDGLLYAFKFPRLNWGYLDITLSDRDGDIVATAPSFSDDDAFGNFIAEREGMYACQMLSTAMGRLFRPKSLKMRHSANGAEDDYAQYFQCPISFEQDINELVFDGTQMTAPMPLADEQSWQFYKSQCLILDRQLEKPFRLADAVKIRIRQNPQQPTLSAIAEQMLMTTRTLQRKLDNEGTDFSTLVREIREEEAKALLKYSPNSLATIADMLGFSDVSAFSRAFRDWTGMAPSKYRQRAAP